MSIYDKASLVLIPSGTKTSKVYSQKPVNGDGDFTFSRSTAATRVNADGNIEKEGNNQLLHSNSFVTSWTGNNSGITGGFAGYDGTNNASQHNATGGYSYRAQFGTYTGVCTFSIYAKAGTAPFIRLYTSSSPSVYTNFDLVNGTIQPSGAIDSKMVDVGNGWYRCSMTFNATNNNLIYFYCAGANGDVGITTTGDNIYVQHAQVEQGLVARDYIETTTAAVEGGITDNVPRLDYTDSSCPALLLEPQRTNDVAYSEYAGSTYWSKSNSIITNNAATSPEGLDNAFELTDNTSNGYHWIYRAGVASVSNHRISFFAKANTLSQVWSNGGSGSNSAGFDLSNGTIVKESGNANAKIEDYGNGWYRCSFTSDANGVLIATMKNDDETYAGTGQSIYMYGIQSEQEASYETSYIPTYGTSVTRNRDVTGLTSASGLIGQTEGTIYSEVRFLEEGNTSNWLSISSGNPQNWVFIGKDNDDIRGYVRASNSVIFTNQSFQIVDNAIAKVAIAYKSGEVVLYINGTQISSSSTAFTFDDTLDSIYFGSHDNGATYETRKQNQALLFKTRLSNEELAALTTI